MGYRLAATQGLSIWGIYVIPSEKLSVVPGFSVKPSFFLKNLFTVQSKKKKKKKKKKYTPYALLACCVARAQYLGVFFDLGEIK